MTLAQKHGFRFVAADGKHPDVQLYVLKHLYDNGYPLDTVPSAEHWALIVRKDPGGREAVYGVFGWKTHADFVEITDFYLHPSRFGVIAGYAAMERIKADSDASSTALVTSTPPTKSLVMHAYKKFFGVTTPALLVYRYDPPTVSGRAVAEAV